MSAPTPYVVDTTVDAVISALTAFITPFVPSGCPIIRGQQNRSPMPGSDPFVKLTEILRPQLSTPITYPVDSTTSQQQIQSIVALDVQVDFYGPTAGDLSQAVTGVYRAPYSVDQFPAGIAPLYCTDAHQMALRNDEQQYEARWTTVMRVEYNPSVYIPVQFATALSMNIVEDIL